MYRRVLSDGTLAAIKLFRRESKQGERSFGVQVSHSLLHKLQVATRSFSLSLFLLYLIRVCSEKLLSFVLLKQVFLMLERAYMGHKKTTFVGTYSSILVCGFLEFWVCSFTYLENPAKYVENFAFFTDILNDILQYK